ncbi:MAG: hypothetical protein ACLFS1_07385 [Opitutales bacterium]
MKIFLRPAFSHLLLGALLLTGCGDASSGDYGTPIRPGLKNDILESDTHDEVLVRAAIEGIKLHDEYTPSNFESKQREYIKKLKPEMRKPARAYLSNRIGQVQKQEISNIVQLMPESNQLKKTERPDAVRVRVIIEALNQKQARGKTLEPERMVYLVDLLVFDLDRIFYESIAKRAVDDL